MSLLFSQEEITERYGYERFLDGKKAGFNQGRSQTSETIALNMLKNKFEPETIAKCTQLPLNRIRELSKTL